MMDHLSRLTQLVHAKLRLLGFSSPRVSVIRALVDTAYLASLKTEEGRFVRGSVTFADPRAPDINPPLVRRADYPGFAKLRHRVPLTVQMFTKLSRGIDKWSGSIAVYGTTESNVVAWGIVDQIVHQNVGLNRESPGGIESPGILTVTVDAVGELSVYHGSLFLGGLRQDQLVMRETDALRSEMVSARIIPTLMPAASAIARVLGGTRTPADVLKGLFDEWSNTIARLCIGLRRLGTGGAFLISPNPVGARLDMVHQFPYRRLGDATILRVLDAEYLLAQRRQLLARRANAVPMGLFDSLIFAQADAEDREKELTGAVRIVTSLAAMDGLVLLDPSLGVVGFGVKIKSELSVDRVYDGRDFVRKGTRAKRVDPSRFGTRHNSILRYCAADQHALGVIVSQDGQVRLAMAEGRSLTPWENVQLLAHEHDARRYAKTMRRTEAYRTRRREQTRLGYTSMPKTIQALIQSRANQN